MLDFHSANPGVTKHDFQCNIEPTRGTPGANSERIQIALRKILRKHSLYWRRAPTSLAGSTCYRYTWRTWKEPEHSGASASTVHTNNPKTKPEVLIIDIMIMIMLIIVHHNHDL